MQALSKLLAAAPARPRRVLCLGAHADDIEIGCAGTLLRWAEEPAGLELTWVVLCAEGTRAAEARGSARALMRRARALNVEIGPFTDTLLPTQFAPAKAFLAEVARRCDPDIVLTHRLEDRHQDHRILAELTWQGWRDHLVLEYEIPKFEGDLGQPNLYMALPRRLAARKLRHLERHFPSQHARPWYGDATFRGLMALRGLECRAADGLAEAFHLRKALW